MTKFHKLAVAEVIRETAEAVSLSFQIPDALKETFKYKQGQYLTLRFEINGEDLRRSYSICTSPISDHQLKVAIKSVENGRVSNYINRNIKPGDAIEVMPPMGNFYTELNPSNEKNYVLFAGGSGITPMLSILKASLEVENKSKVLLIYGNRNEASIIFNQQLKNLEDQYKERLKVIHILEHSDLVNPLFKGILSPEKTAQIISEFVDAGAKNEFFICGPTGMMQNIEQALNELKFPKECIHLEYFSSPVDTSKVVSTKQGSTIGNETFRSTVTIICDGEERIVEMGADDLILDKAIENNLDAPFACRGGSCCTCRAKVIEGKVEMKINYALLESEVEEGYILTCQSRPLTPVLIVDYDQGR